MRISDWSSDVCSSDLIHALCGNAFAAMIGLVADDDAGERLAKLVTETLPRRWQAIEQLVEILILCTARSLGNLVEQTAIRCAHHRRVNRMMAMIEIGRASCGERVGQEGEISVGAV